MVENTQFWATVKKLRSLKIAESYRIMYSGKWVCAESFSTIAEAIEKVMHDKDCFIVANWPKINIIPYYGDNVKEL